MIRLAKKEDLHDLAIIYKDLYDNVDIGENWSVEKSEELLNYWYNKQGDLFFVAVEDNKPIGAIVSGVKSWFDGLRLVDTEIFVSKEYQEQYIGKALMLEHLKQAKIKYNVKMIEFHTYGDESEFPQNWYNRIGFKKDEELIIMNADVEDVLGKLGYDISSEKINHYQDVYNISYKELVNFYNELKPEDKAFIFDALPEYAYLDNEDEKAYLESRINAMKKGVEVNLFLVGNEKRINELMSNELFKYALDNCYNQSKIYLINSDELKKVCPLEYFQLAQGLYLGIHKDGSKESFRDLWISADNVGVVIKDGSINNYLETCINNIMSKINNGEIPCIKKIVGE